MQDDTETSPEETPYNNIPEGYGGILDPGYPTLNAEAEVEKAGVDVDWMADQRAREARELRIEAVRQASTLTIPGDDAAAVIARAGQLYTFLNGDPVDTGNVPEPAPEDVPNTLE